MKKEYVSPSMLVKNIRVDSLLVVSMNDTPADPSKPVLSKRNKYMDYEEEEIEGL